MLDRGHWVSGPMLSMMPAPDIRWLKHALEDPIVLVAVWR